MGKKIKKMSEALLLRAEQLGPNGRYLVAFAADYMCLCLDKGASVDEALRNAMIHWNIALLPSVEREFFIESLKNDASSSNGNETFNKSMLTSVKMMTQRHMDMFPEMHQLSLQNDPEMDLFDISVLDNLPPLNGKAWRNQSCPCRSGRKYKKCCGDPRINRDSAGHVSHEDEFPLP